MLLGKLELAAFGQGVRHLNLVAQVVAQALRQSSLFKVLGPSDLFKLQDRYRSRLVLKGKNLDQMKAALAQVLQEYRRQRSQAHLSIDVNPLILE